MKFTIGDDVESIIDSQYFGTVTRIIDDYIYLVWMPDKQITLPMVAGEMKHSQKLQSYGA